MPTEHRRLWTIQTLGAWQHLQSKGRLSGDGRRIPDTQDRKDYRWLMSQMAGRLPKCTGKRFPVWFYTTKPDLRMPGYLTKGTRGVRLECRIPARRVLLFNYEGWFHVLNKDYFAFTDEECEDWERRLSEIGHDPFGFFNDFPEGMKEEIRGTWPRMFELDRLEGLERWSGSEAALAAVVEKLHLSDITRAHEFIAR